MKNIIKIGLIYGGRSGEHEVSIKSAESIYKALDKKKYSVEKILIDKQGGGLLDKDLTLIDVIFPIIHARVYLVE